MTPESLSGLLHANQGKTTFSVEGSLLQLPLKKWEQRVDRKVVVLILGLALDEGECQRDQDGPSTAAETSFHDVERGGTLWSPN